MKLQATLPTSLALGALVAFAGLAYPGGARAADENAAKLLARQSNCFKCHAVDKKKDGPSYKETAKKYKGKPDAEETLIKHVTTKPMIEVDGKKEEHKALKSTDPAEVKNAVDWILSL